MICSLLQGGTKFKKKKLFKPPQSWRRRKGDMNQIPNWGPENIERHFMSLSRPATRWKGLLLTYFLTYLPT